MKLTEKDDRYHDYYVEDDGSSYENNFNEKSCLGIFEMCNYGR